MAAFWRSRPVALVCAVAGGTLAQLGHVPLAWVLGPLVTTVFFSVVVGSTIFAPNSGRRLGQVVIGAALGLAVTPSVASQVLPYLWLMIFTPFLAIAISAIVALSFSKIAGVDRRTAFFCMVPGGLSEMANIGDRYGARREPIALAQAIRVALVVCTFPPFMVMLGWDGHFESVRDMTRLEWQEGAWVGLFAVVGVLATRLARFNNHGWWARCLGLQQGLFLGCTAGRCPEKFFMPPSFF